MPNNTLQHTEAPTYRVVTYGCQMNVHDSERIAGLLEEAGYVPDPRTDTLAPADVVVFNTCAVRENADNRLYGTLGHMAAVKSAHPGMQLAVGGCMAQKDKDTVVARAPWVDVVFGTHNVGSLPVLLKRARHNATAQVEIEESLVTFPSNLPARRDSAYSAWVSISVGCNNTCTFCIVPQLRGKETDRRPGEILSEIRALVNEGVQEITLLGQNVNSYGVQFGDRGAFAKLLRACGNIDGLERVRFTSPHPAEFTDDVIEAMAQTAGVIGIKSVEGTEKPRAVYFLTIDKCKFRKPVLPGDTIEYHMRSLGRRKTMWWFHGDAKVNGQVVAEADVGAMLTD